MYLTKKLLQKHLAALLLLLGCCVQLNSQSMQKPVFDWQGHRGARGLVPENTIPSFLKALEFPSVTTLELDLAVSKDNILIVSHEPWMSEAICSKPGGSPVTKDEAMGIKIMELTYEEIKQYDCGSRGNARFPEQVPLAVHKPSLSDVVDEVKKYCSMRNMPLPHFNIEIKSRPEGDGLFTPPIGEFAGLVVGEVKRLGIADRSCIQSFDVRALQAVKALDPGLTLALLVENLDSPQKNIERLGFKPDIYSPYYLLLKKKRVAELQQQGIRVIPWTVNTVKAMKKLIRMGVDGIITDYPNLISAL